MDSDASGLTEIDTDVLTFEVPDSAVERAAGVTDGKITTYVYCTYAWYICMPDQ